VSEAVREEAANANGYTSVLNGRFKGGYITRHYGDPARGVDAIQLEIAQRAYLDESAPQNFVPAAAADLKTVLRPLLACGSP